MQWRLKQKRKALTHNWFWLLVGIFILGLWARTWHLGGLPRVFFVDEVLSGYVGRYILQNGVDIYNHSWPKLYFNNFGDYYIVGPMYLDGLSTLIFGVNRFAVRLPTALFGALLSPLMYFFTYLLFKKKRLGLLTALVVAISPWHIVLSRATTESVIETTLLVAMMTALTLAWKKSVTRWLVVASGLGLLAYLTYHTARMLTPMIWVGFWVAWLMSQTKLGVSFKLQLRQLWPKRATLLVSWLVLMSLFFSLTLYISRTPWGRGRFDQTSIFSEQSGVSIRMTEMTYNLGHNQVLLARVFHNKILGYSREFIHQYFQYFSPNYLFLNGWQKSRYTVPEAGPLYLIFAPLALIGLVTLFRQGDSRKETSFLITWLLLIAPVPASFAVIESPNVRRSLFLLIPLVVLIGLGLDQVIDWISQLRQRVWQVLILGSIVVFLIGESIFFAYHYLYQADLASAYYRGDGYDQVVEYVNNHLSNYDRIYLPSRGFLPVRYLFYTRDFNRSYATQFKPTAHIDHLGDIYFIDHDCPSQTLTPNDITNHTIVIDLPSCQTPKVRQLGFKLLDSLHGVDQLLSFKLYSVLLRPSIDTK